MSQSIPFLALLQEELTITARRRISEMFLLCEAICMNPHNIQIASLQLTKISNLLDYVLFGMDGKVRESTSLRPRAHTIRRNRKDLPPLYNHRNMETNKFTLAHSHCVWILQEPLQEAVITGPDRLGHLNAGWWWEPSLERGVQFLLRPSRRYG